MDLSDLEFNHDTQEVLEEVRNVRGNVLPLHRVMGLVGADVLRDYDRLASNLLFHPNPRHLDLKTRYLVLVAITTAVKGDSEGVEWSTRRAIENGATKEEVLEAILLAGLPAGMPAVEGAVRDFKYE